VRIGSNKLAYPFESRPEQGELLSVAPGVFWVRMPLPISLNHINVWVLEDGDGWTIVDTGMGTDDTRRLWQSIFDNHLDSKPVTRVIGTHMHFDHVGLAGWIADKWDAPLWMTRSEYLSCRVTEAEIQHAPPDSNIEFFKSAGFAEDDLAEYRRRFQARSQFLAPLPSTYRRLQKNAEVRIGNHGWRVLIGSGHSPEHACLYCEELDVLIAGDQVLPRISPNVGVRPDEPLANPMRDWIDSCRALKDELSEDVLVLPSHGDPFHGAHPRLDALIQEHQEGFDKLYDYCDEPRRVVDVFGVLFKGEIDSNNFVIATGEALAYLNYLLDNGTLKVEIDSGGINRYSQA
jgi:glyoxylase-like metal-dependent hydrolase (beta-lactamase superfamily II)